VLKKGQDWGSARNPKGNRANPTKKTAPREESHKKATNKEGESTRTKLTINCETIEVKARGDK